MQKLSNIIQSRVAELDIENSTAALQAYARISQMISYGHQLTNAEDKKIVIKHVNDFLKSLHMITTLHKVHEIASSAEEVLKALHIQARDVENNINSLLAKTQIDSAMYGKYQPNTQALLGINFANDLLIQAQANALVNKQKSLVIHDEDGIPSMISIVDIEQMLNNPNMSASYQVVLPGQSINEDMWKELTIKDFEELKQNHDISLYVKQLTRLSQKEADQIEQLLNSAPGGPEDPENDNDNEEEKQNAANQAIQNAKTDWIKLSDLLKQTGVEITPQELEALFKSNIVRRKHVIRPQLKRYKTSDPNFVDCELSGGHLDFGNKLRNSGITSPSKITPHFDSLGNENGFWQSDLIIGKLIKPQNCYFPSHWSEGQLWELASYVLENPNRATLVIKQSNPYRLIIEGLYKNSKIKVVLETSKEFITTYPLKTK